MLTDPERIYPNVSHMRVGAHGDALCHDLDFVASKLNVMTTLPDDLDHRFPSYSRGEYLADLAAHVLGLALGLVATVALLIEASHFGQPLLLVGAGLYGLGLVAM